MTSASKDYTVFYKKKFANTRELKADKSYDIFVSGYNDSRRVRDVFHDIDAQAKHWIMFSEYHYTSNEAPILNSENEKIFSFEENLSESAVIRKYFEECGIDFASLNAICIDITGFIRPHLVFLVRYLAVLAVKEVDFIYSDPIKYVKGEQTDFSFDYTHVRQIDGCQGLHNPETTNDYLLIGAGYDHLRIMDVSKNKNNTKKVQLFGFPSLQPDMYQENVLKAYKASEETVSKIEEILVDEDNTIFAPANDPFVTAQVIRDFIIRQNTKKPITNMYFCPLSTKAQTLGIALYYISECLNEPTSIIFPICSRYSKETTEGLAKIWRYTVEFNNI
ncbi:hypothetical protein [Mucilaginibacter sp. PAMB04168]|uniref:hypothetical protein n=1 Tax=Mucilaginibacter sp. PAMB04168 TaxID=3138567 RepID=UPI0031F7016B